MNRPRSPHDTESAYVARALDLIKRIPLGEERTIAGRLVKRVDTDQWEVASLDSARARAAPGGARQTAQKIASFVMSSCDGRWPDAHVVDAQLPRRTVTIISPTRVKTTLVIGAKSNSSWTVYVFATVAGSTDPHMRFQGELPGAVESTDIAVLERRLVEAALIAVQEGGTVFEPEVK